jgi:hypothetical protein
MLKNKIHYETKVDEEEFTFICRAGCPSLKAYQAADEYRTFIYGLLKQQEDQQAQQKASEEPPKQE